tara:strand:- start:123 stop:269 length:147 start_codon:yes stop_codon:yes gene_type:complete
MFSPLNCNKHRRNLILDKMFNKNILQTFTFKNKKASTKEAFFHLILRR